MQFFSTLYLQPVLDFLMADVPQLWRAEIRLGLQEALVNAVCHGNKLDPNKKISAQYTVLDENFTWVITDQGEGETGAFAETCDAPPECSEEGRGIFILQQIFDRVEWQQDFHALYLQKRITDYDRPHIM